MSGRWRYEIELASGIPGAPGRTVAFTRAVRILEVGGDGRAWREDVVGAAMDAGVLEPGCEPYVGLVRETDLGGDAGGGDEGPTNADRRRWARAGLRAYMAARGTAEDGDAGAQLRDLVTDLLHLHDELRADDEPAESVALSALRAYDEEAGG